MDRRKRAHEILSVQIRALCQEAQALPDGAAHEQIDDYLQQMQQILEKYLHTDESPQSPSDEGRPAKISIDSNKKLPI